MTEVTLLAATLGRLAAHAAETYPVEACGLLLGRREGEGLRITRALPCPNVAEASERRTRFVIDPRAVLNVQRALRGAAEEIVGFYHSHPDAEARPSATDLEYVRLWPETVWIIVPVHRGEPGSPRSWWLEPVEADVPRELALRTIAPRDTGSVACPE